MFKRQKNGLHWGMNWFVTQMKVLPIREKTSMFLKVYDGHVGPEMKVAADVGRLGLSTSVQCSNRAPEAEVILSTYMSAQRALGSVWRKFHHQSLYAPAQYGRPRASSSLCLCGFVHYATASNRIHVRMRAMRVPERCINRTAMRPWCLQLFVRASIRQYIWAPKSC